MSNVFTLDAIREETIKRYAPTKIELSDGSQVELKSVLKLKKQAREEVLAAIEEIQELGDDELEQDEETEEEYAEIVCEAVAKIIRLICPTPRKLISELEHDDVKIKASLFTAVLQKWIGDTQLGEAGSSPS